ncbi:S-adenosyl-L-methionine-dependent methyltransferase [Xylariaceae sp. FL0804]|nr:S-adenosyl-L-methionine-dependent methyltransferase [Xylariaceae sp. FL0804]
MSMLPTQEMRAKIAKDFEVSRNFEHNSLTHARRRTVPPCICRQGNMAAPLDAASIARFSPHNPANFDIQHSQTIHRLELLQRWNIPTGSRVLELGCGQGDCTTVLAFAVGEQGSVVAVDPADMDYGKSLARLVSSPLDYLSSLASTGQAFDVTVLAHCLWYFASPSLILLTFRAIKQHSKRLAALECRKPKSVLNVRTVLSPKRLTDLALAAVEEHVRDEREEAVVVALRDACEASLKCVQGGVKGVRVMDVWTATFI